MCELSNIEYYCSISAHWSRSQLHKQPGVICPAQKMEN